jgi:hypothetical protein
LILIDELTLVCQAKFTYRITEVTKKASSFDQERLQVEHPVSPSYPVIALVPTVDRRNHVARVIIDMLPDVALLEVFDFYINEEQERIEAWHTLVHVCRNWRIVAFGSPRRLDLRLHCNVRTPVRETLDVWPHLPIVIKGNGDEKRGVDNIIAALERNDRICTIDLWRVSNLQLKEVLAAMQQPFPALTRLEILPEHGMTPVEPGSFLGGSAPCLRTLWLDRIPFPGLPKLLLSATHLVDLDLWRIPHSGYIPPEAIVTSLSVLTRLEKLVIEFESPRSRPEWKTRRLPPPTRTLLPRLIKLRFKGVSEYLEDIVAHIDAPLLDNLVTTFFHQLIFDTPQLAQFIDRTPKFKAYDEARVVLSYWHVSIIFPQTFDGTLELAISCRQPDWQLSSLAQVCSLSFSQALIPTVEHLYIQIGSPQVHWQDDIESSQWLEFFHPFTAMKHLYLSQELAPRIAPVLQDVVGESVTEVLPALQALFLEEPLPSGSAQEGIGQFVAARQLAGYPIAVSCWKGVENV